jgi:hypothetical protein
MINQVDIITNIVNQCQISFVNLYRNLLILVFLYKNKRKSPKEEK